MRWTPGDDRGGADPRQQRFFSAWRAPTAASRSSPTRERRCWTWWTRCAHSCDRSWLPLIPVGAQEWAADKLPDDDIQIPPDHDVPSEDEVEEKEGSKKTTDKWTELGLHQLEQS